ncbi:MAG TPA: hypothetical protein VFA99_03105 [Acidobacteriaceae bacterium]|nr:hypothetical protein [Acidobacteriaceae bacterium]
MGTIEGIAAGVTEGLEDRVQRSMRQHGRGAMMVSHDNLFIEWL